MACVIASLGLLAGDQQGLMHQVRSALATAVYPLQVAVSSPLRTVHHVFDSVSGYARVVAENRRLKAEQTVLKTKLLKFAALEQENTRLRGLLDRAFTVGEQMLIAEALAVNLVPYEHLIVVNKGGRFGVYEGQPVFDANGVVGQVVRVTPNHAEVMLITDPNHAIPVQVNRNGLRTIAVGSGQFDRLELPYLSSNADIQVGDLLITSGMGGTFPAGYPVATITASSPQQSPFVTITAEPLAPLDRIRELLLVWSKSEPIPRASGVPGTSAHKKTDGPR